MPAPCVSVLIPFGDPRAEPVHLAGWTRQQTLEPHRFEVLVVVTCESSAAQVRPLLRAHDRLLLDSSRGTFAHYDLAARAAASPLLFFTEDHCVADPDCLEVLLRSFHDRQFDGATVRWGHINRSPLARMESLLSHEDMRTWFEPDHWNRVRIRGFGLKASVYHEVGGLRWQFGAFSEALLAAALHAGGYRLEFISESGVRHINTNHLSELYGNVWGHAWQQSRYLHEAGPGWWDAYFGAGGDDELSVPGARRFLKALWRARKAMEWPKEVQGPWAGFCLRLIAAGLAMPAARQAAARLGLLRHWLDYHFWWFHEGRRCRSVGALWKDIAECARADYAASHGGRQNLEGFYPLEEFGGVVFRWSRPVAGMTLSLPEGEHRAVLDTGGLRGPASGVPMVLFWDGRMLAPNSVSCEDSRAQFLVVSQGGTHHLTIVTEPMRAAPPDSRWLGLPLVSAEFQPVAPCRSGWTWKPGKRRAEVPVRPQKVVSVNTSDQGGGAEDMAYALFQGYHREGWDSWFVVGNKKRQDPRVLSFFDSPHLDYSRARPWLPALRRACDWLGVENFEFPDTHELLQVTGSLPDVVHLHNLHGPYFDLRALALLSQSTRVFFSLHDSWLFTGHCACPFQCERWRTGCGECPDLDRPPAIRRDSTAFNWRRKAELLSGCRLRVSTPSRWLMERVEQSLLAPAVVDARVIPNGVDVGTFSPGSSAEARATLGLTQDELILVFAANGTIHNRMKDYPGLLRSMEILAARGLQLRCLVVGEAAPAWRSCSCRAPCVPGEARPGEAVPGCRPVRPRGS